MSRSCSSGSNQGNQAADEVDERTIMLTALRKKTLEVLEMLSEMEGRYRLRAPQRLLADEGKGMVASPLETEAPTLPGVVIASEGPTKNTANDEKPINRSNITLPSLAAEQDVVRDWVEVAKRLLEQTPAVGANRRWSEARDGVSQQDVPEWAMKDGWEDSLSRAYAIIVAQLSDDQTAALPDPSEDRAGSLDALSNGYLLCLSYNATLRLSSPHPFGFISPSSIHPFPLSLSSSTEMYRTASSANDGGGRGEKIGQTFRRAENLRLWAGALKHRYNLALVGPPPFDPKVVAARREEGWRDGLEQAVGEWADIVAKEVRGEEALTRENGAGPLVEPS
ncbi:cytoplasm protein [Rhodotorula toruloides]|uniref:Cytoplasm protein n=1 Tax=Rhodotorula toruloides TaxID=5286 RepID=A0A511K8F6_RHOTO|nr:cytoplasm protein [Rhodotorula toruloides]